MNFLSNIGSMMLQIAWCTILSLKSDLLIFRVFGSRRMNVLRGRGWYVCNNSSLRS